MKGLVADSLKRIIDVSGASVGLVLLAPVFLVISCIMKLSSPGPVFFRQERVGRQGNVFNILKFRTMKINAEDILRADPKLWESYVGNHFKLPEGQDPRISAFGRWMRKTSLDELPQLWNVLIGEMSLVGPRPLVKTEIEMWYGERARDLLSVRPGMTGLWQVRGRSRVGYPERADLELAYVYERSLVGDILILLQTCVVVIAGRGAH